MIGNAEGFAVQVIRIILLHGIELQLDPCIRICRIVIRGKALAVIAALHIPVIVVGTQGPERILRVREGADGKYIGTPLVCQRKAVRRLSDIPLLIAVITVNEELVLCSIDQVEIVQRRAPVRTIRVGSLRGFQDACASAADCVLLICKIKPGRIAHVETGAASLRDLLY